MHLVFLNQYYPPDAAPTGVMLEAVVEGLLRDGHEVSVLCAAGGYAAENGMRTANIQNPKSKIQNPKSKAGDDGPKRSAPATSAAIADPQPHIIRIGATRFGRNTFAGKLLDYASYYVGVSWKLLTLRPAPQRIVALTTPPYLSVVARAISKLRGADHAHWVMDLYPDVLAAHGMLDERGFAYRLLAGLARWGFGGTRCAALLTLGPDMAERVGNRVACGPLAAGRGCCEEPKLSTQAPQPTASGPPTTHSPPPPVQWVPLWGADGVGGVDGHFGEIGEPPATPSAARALRKARGWGEQELVVMYSGNMGLGHRFEEILAAAAVMGNKVAAAPWDGKTPAPQTTDNGQATPAPQTTDNGRATPASSLRFVFFGGGKRREEVAAFVRGNSTCSVELFDYANADDLTAHLQSADVHLASLDPAWTGTMVPSKVQGIFAAARPVIFIGSAQSSIGQWVLTSGGGWVVAAGDIAGLLKALADACNPTTRAIRGRAAKAFAGEHFQQARNVARVVAILTRPR